MRLAWRMLVASQQATCGSSRRGITSPHEERLRELLDRRGRGTSPGPRLDVGGAEGADSEPAEPADEGRARYQLSTNAALSNRARAPSCGRMLKVSTCVTFGGPRVHNVC